MVGGGRPAAASREPLNVQLVSITDFHGYLRPPQPRSGGTIVSPDGGVLTVGGVAYLATHLKRIRSGVNSFLFTAGDSFSGWPFEVDAHADEPTVEALNALGVRFSAVGNHELDVSPEFLVRHMRRGWCFGWARRDNCFTDSTGRRFRGTRFDFQSANIVTARTGRTIVRPYHVEWVRDPGGRRVPIGFIGATVPDTPTASTSFQPGLRARDIVEAADRYAAELRRHGVAAIVLNMHEGGSDRSATYDDCVDPYGPAIEVARRVSPDIDVIVTGHWHAAFNCVIDDPAGRPRPVVEAANHGRLINEINLTLDPRTGEVIRHRTTSTNHAVTRDVPPDPRLARIVDYWAARGERRYAEPVARITGDFTRETNAAGESTVADLFADVQYWDANRRWAARADLALIPVRPARGASAVRGDLTYAAGGHPDDAPGRVLFGEAWEVYGYGNPILTVTVTGAQLDTVLEEQWSTQADGTVRFAPLAVSANVRYSYDPSRPVGARVASDDVRINGRRLVEGRRYRVAALAYTVIGADGYPGFTGFTHPVRNGTDHETLVAYLRAHKVIRPAPLDRVHAWAGRSTYAMP
jgi:2',3'-cyclic-nucleotide 2'-phosphodiesterase (5'-nucleotidase family)